MGTEDVDSVLILLYLLFPESQVLTLSLVDDTSHNFLFVLNRK